MTKLLKMKIAQISECHQLKWYNGQMLIGLLEICLHSGRPFYSLCANEYPYCGFPSPWLSHFRNKLVSRHHRHVPFSPLVFRQNGKYFRDHEAETWVRVPSFICSCVGNAWTLLRPSSRVGMSVSRPFGIPRQWYFWVRGGRDSLAFLYNI